MKEKVNLMIAGYTVELSRDHLGGYRLSRGSIHSEISSSAAYEIAKSFGVSDKDIWQLGLLPEAKPEISPKQLRRLEFEVPDGAPFELVEAAADYAVKFIPMMIKENMAAHETRVRKMEVEQINKEWADFSERFTNGLNGVIDV